MTNGVRIAWTILLATHLGELVATQPSNHIGGPKGLRQSSRKRSQQRQSVGWLPDDRLTT